MIVVRALFYFFLYAVGNTLHITTSILVMESDCSAYLQINCGGVCFGGKSSLCRINSCNSKMPAQILICIDAIWSWPSFSQNFPSSKTASGCCQYKNLRFLKTLSFFLLTSNNKEPRSAFHNSL